MSEDVVIVNEIKIDRFDLLRICEAAWFGMNQINADIAEADEKRKGTGEYPAYLVDIRMNGGKYEQDELDAVNRIRGCLAAKEGVVVKDTEHERLAAKGWKLAYRKHEEEE